VKEILTAWDGEAVLIRHDAQTGAVIIIGIHSSKFGPATGGTRLMKYNTVEDAIQDAQKLSSGMTYKFALADFPRGGGKAVIALSRVLLPEERHGLLMRYGSWIRQLNGYYYTGPDVGTTPEDMDVIATTGDPYVFSRTPANGGAGGSGEATGYGTYCGMKAVGAHLFGTRTLAGKKILVQGIGSVGRPLLGYLKSEGAEILISDVDERVANDYPEYVFVTPARVYQTPCDIFSPCALGGILNADTIPQLRCKAVVGAANNQLGTEADADFLARQNILYAPDFACNIGGALAITGMEAMGWSKQVAFEQVSRVEQTLTTIFTLADEQRINTHVAARNLVREKLNRIQ